MYLLLFFPSSQVGNAIKSSLHGAALKSNNKEGARSIQVEITPTSSRISRNAVTSLSIRGHRWKRNGEIQTQWGENSFRCEETNVGVERKRIQQLLHAVITIFFLIKIIFLLNNNAKVNQKLLDEQRKKNNVSTSSSIFCPTFSNSHYHAHKCYSTPFSVC